MQTVKGDFNLGERVSYDKEIRQQVTEQAIKMRKEEEQRIIKALGSVAPEETIRLEDAIETNDMSIVKEIASNMEVEQHPNGAEIYKYKGEEFLEITTEQEFDGNSAKLTKKFELL